MRIEKVLLRYVKGSMRVELLPKESTKINRRIGRGLSKALPGKALAFCEGYTYVAYYYLPLLLKTLPGVLEEFGSPGFYLDYRAPHIREIVRCVETGIPDVAAAVALELEQPMTKPLFARKSPEEREGIIKKLTAEYERTWWLDSVWERVECPETAGRYDESFIEFVGTPITFEEATIQAAKSRTGNIIFRMQEIEKGKVVYNWIYPGDARYEQMNKGWSERHFDRIAPPSEIVTVANKPAQAANEWDDTLKKLRQLDTGAWSKESKVISDFFSGDPKYVGWIAYKNGEWFQLISTDGRDTEELITPSHTDFGAFTQEWEDGKGA